MIRILDYLRKPANFIGMLGWIIGIALTIVLFFYSQQSKSITYFIPDKPIKIFDSTASSPKIRVLDEDNELIKENVYLLEVVIWNDGDLPIEPADVRESLRVELSPVTKILDIKIVDTIRPEIAKFSLKQEDLRDSLTKLVSVDWDHLDPGFAIKFQVIYSGTDEVQTEINGYILGIDEFVDGNQPVVNTYLPYGNVIIFGLEMLAAILCYIIFTKSLSYLTDREDISGNSKIWVGFIMLIIYLTIVVGLLYLIAILGLGATPSPL